MPIFLSSCWAECLLVLAGQQRATTLQPMGAALGVWGSPKFPLAWHTEPGDLHWAHSLCSHQTVMVASARGLNVLRQSWWPGACMRGASSGLFLGGQVSKVMPGSWGGSSTN